MGERGMGRRGGMERRSKRGEVGRREAVKEGERDGEKGREGVSKEGRGRRGGRK